MVHINKADRGPRVDIHFVEREIAGKGIAIKVFGDLKIAAHEFVYAYEFGLNTINVLLLTVEAGDHVGYMVQKYIATKGTFNNYASVDVFDNAGTHITAGSRLGPALDGSIWLNFMAIGE